MLDPELFYWLYRQRQDEFRRHAARQLVFQGPARSEAAVFGMSRRFDWAAFVNRLHLADLGDDRFS